MTAYRSTDTCVSCGRAIDVKTAAYTADEMICTTCEAGEMLREADHQSAASSGVGALGWGMLSLVCNPFFIPSILAITGGVRELQTLAIVAPEQRSGRQVQGIIAIGLGAFWPVIFVGMIGLGVLGMIAGAFTAGSYDDPYSDPYYDDPYYDDYAYPPVYDDSQDPAYDPYADPAYEPLEGGFIDDDTLDDLGAEPELGQPTEPH